MATETLMITDAPTQAVFFVVRNSAGNVLDHADNTFKSLGSATTPGLAATENSAFGGVNESAYASSLNLAYVNNTPAIGIYFVEAYRRAGASVNLANDLLLDTQELRVVGGSLVTSGSSGEVPSGYVVKVGANVTSTLGDELQLYARVELNGKPVVLDGTCIFSAYEYGSTVAQWTESPVGEDSLGRFECLKANPNLQDDVNYYIQAVITVGGVTLTGAEDIPCIGSA